METQSPLPDKIHLIPSKAPTLSFSEAIEYIIKGEKVHKLEWNNEELYGFLNGDILSIHKPDGKNYQWIISKGDLLGNDYIVI